MISIGIDIGSYSLKIAEVESLGKSFKILHYQNIPLSADPSKDHAIEILDILRQLQTRYAESSARFVVALPDSNISSRRLLFPFKERHKILKSLPFELEDDIPFDHENCIFDAKISRFVNNQADVLAFAAPIDHIKDHLQVFKDAGIDPDIMSIESVGLANLFEPWRETLPEVKIPEDEETSSSRAAQLILNLGHKHTSLLILSEGALLESHSFDWGGEGLANAIAKKYSLHYVEALK
ncbi:MAG: pilus assembly protein PilM, partial [Bdellovibrio sp.]